MEATLFKQEEEKFLNPKLCTWIFNDLSNIYGCLGLWVKNSNGKFFFLTSGHLANEGNNLWKMSDKFSGNFKTIGETKALRFESYSDYCLIFLKKFDYNGKTKLLQPSFTLDMPPDPIEGNEVKITNFLKSLKQVPRTKNAIVIAAGCSQKFFKGTYIGKINDRYLIKPENQTSESLTTYGDSGSPIYFHGDNPDEKILIGILNGLSKYKTCNGFKQYFRFTPIKHLPSEYIPYTEQTQ